MVEQVCGTPKDLFLQVADVLTKNSGRERTSAICYAVGWTQQSYGAQIIRAAGILQLLLGNMGRPGGGIMALRGHASIQGSTDVPTLFDLLPGYLPHPAVFKGDDTLEKYMRESVVRGGYWSNLPKFIVSLLKAWYGDAATKDNEYGYQWIPKLTGDHSHVTTSAAMADGNVKGFIVFGQNPANGSPNAGLQRRALTQLDWLLAVDPYGTATAAFRYAAPPGGKPSRLKTEAVLKEINGFTVADRTLLPDFAALKDDGSTACGVWIYSGVYPEEGKNMARRRVKGDGWVSPEWGFSWPGNRRMLYNRASADPQGRPWPERKKYVWWDSAQGKWTGFDRPVFPETQPPEAPPKAVGTGVDPHPGSVPFTLTADRRGWLLP